jgi:dTDP-glucose 4,6-dehydratase
VIDRQAIYLADAAGIACHSTRRERRKVESLLAGYACVRTTIAVLGANSFSGTAFCACAARAGYSVMPLRRPVHDLNTGMDAILRAVDDAKPEYFVNFAALNMVAESWKHYADYYRTNLIGVATLANELSRRPFLRKFVQVSTPEVYGTTETFIKEGAPYRPSTPYAVSRAAADMHLDALHRTTGFPVCFTRTVNVYGEGQQPYRIIPKTVLKILRGERLKLHGGGASTRSFIHIRDVAEAILRVAMDGRPGETYHLAHPTQIAIRNLVGVICDCMGVDFEDAVEDDAERPGKDMAYQLDDSKIREQLGVVAGIGPEVGIPETVIRFKAHAANYAGHSLEYEHRP